MASSSLAQKSILPSSVFATCFLYCWYLMPVQWARRAEYLLPEGYFHKTPPSLETGEHLALSFFIAMFVTVTCLSGLALRIFSSRMAGSKSSSKGQTHNRWAEIFFNDYAVLFTSVFCLGVAVYLWCFSAFSAKTGLTFQLAEKFFSPQLETGGRACARITAGFFVSIFSLSYLDPLSCARLYGYHFQASHSSTLWLLSVFGLGGLGGVGGAAFIIISDLLDQFVTVPTWTTLSGIQWKLLVPMVLGTCAGSLTLYSAICSFIHYHWYVHRADQADNWKIQTDAYLAPKDHRHEILLGSFNLILAGTATGCIGYWILTGGHTGLYLWLSWEDLWYLPLSLVAYFFYVDINAYYQHRLFHFPFLYRHFHKWHHRYKAPTAWSATAIHPAEFLLFQFQLMWPSFVFPMHISVFSGILLYVWFYGILDHSGVYFDSIWPWQNDSKFHDDHHRYFHCQFGQNLDWWDRLHGTMRKPNLEYNEEKFMY